MQSFNKLQDGAGGMNRPAVYVLWTGSPNGNASEVNVRGVYGDAHDAADACAALINQGKPAQMSGVMISTPGEIGADGAVWLYSGVDSAIFTAFGDMDAAEARRAKLGGKVRAFHVSGWTGNKGVSAGALRKKALDGLTQEVVEKMRAGAPAATEKAALEIMKLAQKRPASFFGRDLTQEIGAPAAPGNDVLEVLRLTQRRPFGPAQFFGRGA